MFYPMRCLDKIMELLLNVGWCSKVGEVMGSFLSLLRAQYKCVHYPLDSGFPSLFKLGI